MDNKSAGIDYDRQVFAPSAPQPTAAPSTAGIFFFVAVIAAILALGYVGYKGFVQSSGGSTTDVRALNEMQQRVNALEERLAQAEKENHRRALAAAQSSQNSKNDAPAAPAQSSVHSAPRPSYRISGSPAPQPSHAAAPDTATAQKLAGIQQGLGALQNDASSNREAWQATTDKLADVAGQVGVQSVQILRNQDEVNQLLVRTERVAIPFELLHGADPQLIGPVHLGLKSTNQRAQRYTLCVYVQTSSCLELKDKAIYEVAQFAISRDSAPLEVIATKISKDGILGYLEIPREKSRH